MYALCNVPNGCTRLQFFAIYIFNVLGKAQTITKTRAKSTVQMKLIDDKLKIIDDVPTSAVEMAVKEKVRSKVKYIKCKFVQIVTG